MLGLLACAAVPRLLPESISPHHARRGARPVAIVLGCDEVASAIAHRLHCDGLGVVLIAAVDPPALRRGMAFTDAWYLGIAELAGARAIFCSSIRSIPAVLHGRDAIAATTWSWSGVAMALMPFVTIDTRTASQRTRLDRSLAPPMLTVEVVPGAVTGPEFDVAIATSPSARRPQRVILHAPSAGRFATSRNIGDWIRAGDAAGSIGSTSLVAPVEGTLLGLAARGARVASSDPLAEIDPLASPRDCFGLEPDAVTIAAAVAKAIAAEHPAWVDPAFQRDGVPRYNR